MFEESRELSGTTDQGKIPAEQCALFVNTYYQKIWNVRADFVVDIKLAIDELQKPMRGSGLWKLFKPTQRAPAQRAPASPDSPVSQASNLHNETKGLLIRSKRNLGKLLDYYEDRLCWPWENETKHLETSWWDFFLRRFGYRKATQDWDTASEIPPLCANVRKIIASVRHPNNRRTLSNAELLPLHTAAHHASATEMQRSEALVADLVFLSTLTLYIEFQEYCDQIGETMAESETRVEIDTDLHRAYCRKVVSEIDAVLDQLYDSFDSLDAIHRSLVSQSKSQRKLYFNWRNWTRFTRMMRWTGVEYKSTEDGVVPLDIGEREFPIRNHDALDYISEADSETTPLLRSSQNRPRERV